MIAALLEAKMMAFSASQMRAAVSTNVSRTGSTSPVDRLIAASTSLVAVWYSSDFLKIARACLECSICLGASDGDHCLLGKGF